MKKLVSMLLCLALCLGFAAVTASAEEAVTLRVLAGQSTTDAGIEKMIDQALAAKYPNIKLEWECVDWGKDFQPKMQVYMQSGLPDIMIGKAQDVATYGGLGLLAPLTGKPYMAEILDAAKTGVTLPDGQVYGMTFNALYQGVYYNRKIFSELGLTAPKTQEELAAVIKKLTEAGIVPFATHMVDTWSIGNVTMQFAVNDVFNKDAAWGDKFRAGEVSFATDPNYKACYEYNKLIYDNTWKDETFSLEQTACDARMVSGEAAMKVSGSWSIPELPGHRRGLRLRHLPVPEPDGRRQTPLRAQHHLHGQRQERAPGRRGQGV